MEHCIDGETALVRSITNDLASACVEVMSDKALWNRLSANGLAMAERYRWPNVIDKLEELYLGEEHTWRHFQQIAAPQPVAQ